MSEVKVLNKEEFIQQYVLARANAINTGRPPADRITTRGAEAYAAIRKLCDKNINKQ